MRLLEDVPQRTKDSAFSAVLSRVRMIHIITTLLLASLWIILSNRYDEDVQKWAFGAMGSISASGSDPTTNAAPRAVRLLGSGAATGMEEGRR